MTTFEMIQTDEFGNRVTRSYTCPTDGGYIYFGDCLGGRQVCEGLSDCGDTLRASSGDALPGIIRRERRRQLRRARRNAGVY